MGLFTDWVTGDLITAVKLNTMKNTVAIRTDWSTLGAVSYVVGQLAWRNFGNGHTIFDASPSIAPDGSVISSTNSSQPWVNTYPTLMGWNGTSTFGVRVDTARNAENLGGVTASGYVLKAGDTMSGVLTLPAISNGASLQLANSNYSIGSGNTAIEGFNVYRAGTASAANFGHRFQVNGVTRFELRGDATAAINAGLNVGVGGASVSLAPGAADHTYLAFFPRTASPTTRGGYIGFAAAANSDITLQNEISAGNIILGTTGVGVARVNSNVIWDAGNFNPGLLATLAGTPNFTGTPTIAAQPIVTRGSYQDNGMSAPTIAAGTYVTFTMTGFISMALSDVVLISGSALAGCLAFGVMISTTTASITIYNSTAASIVTPSVNARVFRRSW